jgi:hypothetical protein
VSKRNKLSGSQIGGSLSGAFDSNNATSASANKICDAAMENSIATAEPKVKY